jgi:hypothetical protein
VAKNKKKDNFFGSLKNGDEVFVTILMAKSFWLTYIDGHDFLVDKSTPQL